MRFRVLDLFCCAGGAARGYQRAGAYVVGVDIAPRSRYCGDAFIQGDALDVLRRLDPAHWDMIHASPPCQAACTLVRGTHAGQGVENRHPQLVPGTRNLLDATGLPYVIEQPQGHGGIIRTDLRLCMDMFPKGPPPWVQRHRDFEISGFTVPQPLHPAGPVRRHAGYVRGWREGVYRDGPYVAAYGDGGGKATVSEMQHALGIGWTDVREELTEAIPPVFTEHIGRAFWAGRV